jgi:hypothetical protein
MHFCLPCFHVVGRKLIKTHMGAVNAFFLLLFFSFPAVKLTLVVLGMWQRVEAALMGVTQTQVMSSYFSLFVTHLELLITFASTANCSTQSGKPQRKTDLRGRGEIVIRIVTSSVTVIRFFFGQKNRFE